MVQRATAVDPKSGTGTAKLFPTVAQGAFIATQSPELAKRAAPVTPRSLPMMSHPVEPTKVSEPTIAEPPAATGNVGVATNCQRFDLSGERQRPKC